ncbi:hypothetical protein CAEBREN_11184 [Caenorhabditis brenneri]|uniref:Uncharacterized protein n=1 Tax=Caenorhabditis brenneri TaxID=135651 RepID=G0MCP6_CAEBE|nr:hypothetical protein CAEBREN_11184 [Caenorhabditis brenneri]
MSLELFIENVSWNFCK